MQTDASDLQAAATSLKPHQKRLILPACRNSVSHTDFYSVSQLSAQATSDYESFPKDCLPEDILAKIQSFVHLVVRVRIQKTGPANCPHLDERSKSHTTCSGVVTSLHAGQVVIQVPLHAVGERTKAEDITVDFFYDNDEEGSGIISIPGMTLTSDDLCHTARLTCGTSQQLTERLCQTENLKSKLCNPSDMVTLPQPELELLEHCNPHGKFSIKQLEEFLNHETGQFVAVLISHPHGFPKRVSIGCFCGVDVGTQMNILIRFWQYIRSVFLQSNEEEEKERMNRQFHGYPKRASAEFYQDADVQKNRNFLTRLWKCSTSVFMAFVLCLLSLVSKSGKQRKHSNEETYFLPSKMCESSKQEKQIITQARASENELLKRTETGTPSDKEIALEAGRVRANSKSTKQTHLDNEIALEASTVRERSKSTKSVYNQKRSQSGQFCKNTYYDEAIKKETVDVFNKQHEKSISTPNILGRIITGVVKGLLNLTHLFRNNLCMRVYHTATSCRGSSGGVLILFDLNALRTAGEITSSVFMHVGRKGDKGLGVAVPIKEK